MNKQISRIAIVSLLLLTALIVATTYWQVWAAPGLAARQDNAIQRVAQFKIKRGLIYASDGKTVLAKNVTRKGAGQTLYFRTYPTHGFASQVVGYSTQGRSRAGSSAGERVPDGGEREPRHDLGQAADKLKGTTVRGNNLVLNLKVGPQRIAETAVSAASAGGGRAQPEDRRRLRHGVLAVLRPEQDRVAERLREHPFTRRTHAPVRTPRCSIVRRRASTHRARRSRW